MKNITFFLILCIATLVSCHRAGQVVGKGASQFIGGMGEGIDKTFECKITLSDSLKLKGLKTGKYAVSDSTLTVYLEFDKNFNQKVKVRVVDKNGLEYGRAFVQINGTKDSAQYFDFVFDRRTHIESRSNFVME